MVECLSYDWLESPVLVLMVLLDGVVVVVVVVLVVLLSWSVGDSAPTLSLSVTVERAERCSGMPRCLFL